MISALAKNRSFKPWQVAALGSMFSAGLNLESEKRELEQVSRYRISVFAIGGDGLPKLRQLVTSAKLSEVRPILKDYVETLTEEKSVPIQFLTTPRLPAGGLSRK